MLLKQSALAFVIGVVCSIISMLIGHYIWNKATLHGVDKSECQKKGLEAFLASKGSSDKKSSFGSPQKKGTACYRWDPRYDVCLETTADGQRGCAPTYGAAFAFLVPGAMLFIVATVLLFIPRVNIAPSRPPP